MPQRRKTIHDLLLSFDDTRTTLHLVAKFGWIDRDFFLSEISKRGRATGYRHWRLLIDLGILERGERRWSFGGFFIATKNFHRHFPEIARVPAEADIMWRRLLIELRLGYALMMVGIPFQTRREIWPTLGWPKDQGSYPSICLRLFLGGAWWKYRIFVFDDDGYRQLRHLRGQSNVIAVVRSTDVTEALYAISTRAQGNENHFANYVLVIDEEHSDPRAWTLTGSDQRRQTFGEFLKNGMSKDIGVAA